MYVREAFSRKMYEMLEARVRLRDSPDTLKQRIEGDFTAI